MNLSRASDARFQTRVQAVEKFLASGSVKNVTSLFKIRPKTLKRWIKRYQTGGWENLKRKRTYTRQPRRFSPRIEEKIVLLKEGNPGLTVVKTQEILLKNGIDVSTGGIWEVWKRYNLAGLYERENPSAAYISETQEIVNGIKEAKAYLNKGDKLRAVRVVNALPVCFDKNVLNQIPDRLLSLQKRLEKLRLTFYEMSFPKTVFKARNIRHEAEKRRLFYTAIHAGLFELFAMDWAGNHREQLSLSRKLKNRSETMKGRGNCASYLRLEILNSEARSLAKLGRYDEALSCVRKIDILCRRLSYSHFFTSLATVYSAIGLYKRSRYWIEKSLKFDKKNKSAQVYLSTNLAMAADYALAERIIKTLKKEDFENKTIIAIPEALCALGQGRIEEAAEFANKIMSMAEKKTIAGHLWLSSFIHACCYCGLGKETEARALLQRMDTRFKKSYIKYSITAIILNKKSVSQRTTLMPNVKLAGLLSRASRSLNIVDYRRAFNYASTKYIMGLFHRLILFFPAPVYKLIAKGKSTGLPKELLRLPVFQKSIPVYHLNFLGPVRVYRNNAQLKPNLPPIYASLLIHLVAKKKIELNTLCNNFWRRAKNPRRSFSHLLYGLRKYLRLPTATLFMKNGFLHSKVNITTDYQDYKDTIIRAEALERVGEWTFAKKEFLRAFVLFRGAPFKKMYDPWSEHMRRVILNKLETEAIHFAKSCLERGNRTDAKRVLDKVTKIIPQSEEIRNMVNGFG